MSIRSSHAASWHSDKWYRRAWFIWPQVASLLVVGWVFAGVLLPTAPWAPPEPPKPAQLPPPPKPTPTTPRPNTDETICGLSSSYSGDPILNACGRLIAKGAVWPYFNRAQIYFRNGDYDRAIQDFSAIIQQHPYSEKVFNERGLSYAKKGEYDRAIADYTKAIRLNREPVGPYINRGSAYEKKGELDKALADFREALSHGSTTASEDIKRIEGAIQSLPASDPSAVQLAGGHYEMPGYRWVSDEMKMDGKSYTRVGLVWTPVEQSKYVVDGISLGARVSFKSSDLEYQCRPSEQFEGVRWCNKQRVEEEARGSFRSSYTIAHSRDGTIYYLNRFLEPAFFNAGEVDNEIERLSDKFGEQHRRVRPHVRLGPNTDGIIATWGKVALEPLDATGTSELAAGRSPRKGILVDFLGNLSESARHGLDVYRVTGGPGFVWAGSFNSRGQGTVRFFAIDPSVLLPMVSKDRTEVVAPANPQNDCDGLAANPSDRGKPPSVPGVPYDSLMNQAEQAIEVCTLAVQQNPAELRYEYQLARAMEAEVPEKAVEIHKRLAGKGYAAAYDNLGSLMVKLYENYGAAITYFKTGSQLQDPDSMVSLAGLIDWGIVWGYVKTDRPNELKYQLLRTAADLGHQGAQLEIPEEEEKLTTEQRRAAPRT
jgi:tetratricopeptide (TPR) repeat protein